MVSSLNDPVTLFLDPEETKEYESGNRGDFEGIGAELGYRNNQITVVAPLDGSPAQSAGIRSGDIILAVDGEAVDGKSILQVVGDIRGKSGTKVVLTVRHLGEDETSKVTITRGKILVPSMEYEQSSNVSNSARGIKVGVLDLDRFTEDSYEEWVGVWNRTVQDIRRDNPDVLILDLRGNPGGYFSAAIYAAGEFLPKGTVVVQQKDRNGNIKKYQVDRDGKLKKIPLALLVNEGSASASEILAGALQSANRATIVGVNTFGKGTAQDVIKYQDGSSLHITIYKWLLPDGHWLNPKHPITPDIEVEMTEDDFKEGKDPQMEKAIETAEGMFK